MDKTPDDDDRKGMLSWAFAYQMLLHDLEQKFQSKERKSSEVLNELKREWGQISHVQRWCIQHLDNDDGAAMMCSKFAGVGGNLLDHFLSRLDLIRLREVGLAGARKTKLVEDQIGHLTYLSYAHFVNDNANKAIELLDEAIEIGRKQKDSKGYATALQHRGMFYARMGREKEAIEVLNDSLFTFEKLGDDQAKAKSVSTLAVCYSRLNDPQKSIDLYNQAIEIESNRSAVGTYLCNMASDLMKLQRFSEARDCLTKAEKTASELSNRTLLGLVYALLGQWHAAQKDAELRSKAWRYYEDALTNFRKKGERYHELKIMRVLESLYTQILNNQPEQLNYEQQSTAFRNLVRLLFAQGKHNDNLQICKRLLALAEANENLPDQLEAAISLGHTSLQLKQYEKAIQAHKKAIVVLQKIRRQDGQDVNLKAEGEIQLSLGQAYRHNDQPREAIQCYKRAEKIAETLHNSEMKYRALGNRGLLYADLGRHSDSIAFLTETFEYYEQINDHRLLGHAQFNLAYAYFRRGDLVEAKTRGLEALRYLVMINDSYTAEVKRQIESWEKKSIEP